jgi:hypothetical protein
LIEICLFGVNIINKLVYFQTQLIIHNSSYLYFFISNIILNLICYIQCNLLRNRIHKIEILMITNSVGHSYRISAPKQRYTPLWTNSACSLSYCSVQTTINKAEKFQYGSIYSKDDPFKSANIVNEYRKPDFLLMEFRRRIR